MTCTNPIMVKANDGSGYMMVACGKCDGCLADKAREWCVRVVNEGQMYSDNVVINLSYDDEHLPKGGTLLKSDYQKFLKLLRKRVYPDKVRYFLCGEYGDKFGRCHWHIIVFGLSMWDYRVFSGHILDNKGHYVVKCSCWDKGRVVVDYLSRKSASYVSRYTTKKIGKHTKDWYLQQGLLPEFIAMSCKPGIGFSWMEKYKNDVLTHNFVLVDGVKYKVPRYYFNKLGIKDTIGYEMMKDKEHQDYIEKCINTPLQDRFSEAVDTENKLIQKSRNNRKFMEIRKR